MSAPPVPPDLSGTCPLADAALEASGARFRFLAEHASDVLTEQAEDGTYLYVSPASTEVLGHAPEALVGTSCYAHCHPDDLPALLDAHARVRDGGERLAFVHRFRRADGGWAWVETVSRVVAEGARHRLVSVTRDVGPQRAAVDALRESEARFRAAMEGSLDAFFILRSVRDAGGRIRDFRVEELNARGVALLGREREAIVGRPISRLVRGVRRSGTLAWLADVVRTREAAEREVAVATPDVKAVWLRQQAVPLGDGVAVTARDITAHRLAEAMQREREALYRMLPRNFPNGAVLIFDQDLRYRIVEGAGLAAVHLAREDLEGRTVWEVFPPETCALLVPQYREALAGGESSEEVSFQGRTYLRMAVPLRSERGDVVAGMILTQDITGQKSAEAALRQARDAAEAASRAKSEFLARMSHELRTPLNSVIGFANVLRKNREGNLTGAQLNYLARIATNGRHLLGLIDSILDLAKVEAGRSEVECAPVALDLLVTEVVQSLEAEATMRGLALAAEVPDGLRPLDSDAGKLRQVLINLVGNALKFTPAGGVVVRVEADPASREPLQLVVQDTGIGIPADRLAAIFEPFEQADSGTARRFGGSGLGLAISRSLCELLGYDLRVTSEVGKGSCFTIALRHLARHAA